MVWQVELRQILSNAQCAQDTCTYFFWSARAPQQESQQFLPKNERSARLSTIWGGQEGKGESSNFMT